MRYIRKIKAETQIRRFFENTAGKRVFSFQDLSGIIEQYREEWNLPVTTSMHKLVDRFVDNGILKLAVIQFEEEKPVLRYLYSDPSIYELAVSFAQKSYISHFPAAFLQGLTPQIPKTIYATHEQSAKLKRPGTLTQAGIDQAFAKPQRLSEVRGIYEDYTMILLNGMFTDRLGVNTTPRGAGGFAVTGLERTLIDITVRPAYGGGAFAVLDAYTRALEQDLSVNKLSATLQKIGYIYPYHQAVGFYLERAGYSGKHLDLLKKMPIEFDFYLDYQLTDPAYSKEWRIYYPNGM